MTKGIFVVSEYAENKEKRTVDLEEALNIVGLGWYNVKYCLLLAGFLIAVILETAGYSYVLTAGRCDLGMSDQQRGLVSSLPYLAIVVTSHMWGYLADTRGRKPIILFTSFMVGILGAIAFFMPEIRSFAAVKFVASLFMASPAGISYALIGEILPARHCDTALSVINAMMILGASAIPLLAWWILRWDFYLDFGIYIFRPWRILGMVYSLSFVVCALFMLSGPESPKYLVARGRTEEALAVLQKMYVGNKGKRPEDFPVASLHTTSKVETAEKQSVLESLAAQTAPLFRPPYLKWMALNSFLLFGVMSTLNGLFMWVPDVLNRVLSGGAGSSTACQVIAARVNSSVVGAERVCDDYIETSTIMINAIANTCAAVVCIAAGISVQLIGKKTLIVGMYLLVGLACVAINHVTQTVVFAALLSSVQLTAIGIGPVNAYSVAIFPTHLRGMAVGLSIMFGRLGSVIGTNVAGLLINASCESTFYGFGGLLLLCACLSFLLPNSNNIKK